MDPIAPESATRFPHLNLARRARATFFGAGLLLSLYIPLLEARTDELILKAHQAWSEKKDTQTLKELMAPARRHPLGAYVEGWYLQRSIGEQHAETVQDFLGRHHGSVVAELVRDAWVVELAERGKPKTFFAEWAHLRSPGTNARCSAWRLRLQRGDRAALAEAREALWLRKLSVSRACEPLFNAIARRSSRKQIEQRARLQVARNYLSAARKTLAYLGASYSALSAKNISSALKIKKNQWLNRIRARKELNAGERLLTSLVIGMLSNKKPEAAAEDLYRLEHLLERDQRAWTWGTVALRGALIHHPSAMIWYNKVDDDVPLSESMLEWRVRAALRAKRWLTVHRAIQSLPPTLRKKTEWIYWLARAERALNNGEAAYALWRSISNEIDYYGVLAREELGDVVHIPPRAPEPSTEEIRRMGNIPALQRAVLFSRLGLFRETVKEWERGTEGLSDNELLAAAHYASRQGAYNRSISALISIKGFQDMTMRFPKPYLAKIRSILHDRDMDENWIYGLIRQESRFMHTARSWAGAQGLMQLMPKTARWVAGKVGFSGYRRSRINELETNVRLGSAYLYMVYEQLNGSQVLATAAYNAGPGRARRWCAERPLEGAIYAETIPFTETRNYVKAVLINTVYYSTLQSGRPDSLKNRLGTVSKPA